MMDPLGMTVIGLAGWLWGLSLPSVLLWGLSAAYFFLSGF